MFFKTKLLSKIICVILFTSLFISCSKKSDKIEAPDKIDFVLSELMVVESMSISDSLKASLINKKLKENDITIPEIRNHIKSHKKNPEYWKNTYNRIKKIIEEN